MNRFTSEQRQVIEELDVNVAVSAGAGAGKTRVLVERYLNIIVQGKASCEEIIAITFTKKAATEMRERIRADLIKKLDGLTGESWFYWNEIKSHLEYAAISTFHSLCGRILRENPVEAGIDPTFTVLDEVESKLLIREVIDQVIMKAAGSDASWLGALLQEYSLETFYQDFMTCYEALDSKGWLGENLADYLGQPYQNILAQLPEKKQHLQELLLEFVECRLQLKKGSAGEKKLTDLWVSLPEILAALTVDGQAENFNSIWTSKVSLTLKGIRLTGTISEIKKALDLAAIDWCESLACKEALVIVTHLAVYFNTFAQQLNKIKQERQVVTFADLEIQTLALLKNHLQLCRKYNRKYRYIMVDEFQDTNERQKEFIYLLAGANAAQLSGHKLFIVGDPKQSIYRFRGANVQVFEQVKRDIVASGGACITLDTNFRSQTGLIDLCNQLFEQLFQDDQAVKFHAIKGNKTSPELKQYCEWLLLPKPNADSEISPRAAEAAMIASRLRQMIDQQERHILDEQTHKLRPVRYNDIAILFRAFTDVGLYEVALKSAGVPYYVVGGRGFYSCQEIVDVINLLKIIDNCYDDLAWVGALRSPLFLLQDLTLVALKADNCPIWNGLKASYSQLEISNEQRLICQQVLTVMNALRAEREYLPLPELIERALQLTGYREFLLSQFMGKQKLANVEKFISVAEQQAAKGSMLHDFLDYIARLLQEDVKEGEAQIESEAGDTVKILTIHKSKGMEYPVVILPDLQRKFIAGNSKALFDQEWGLGLTTSHSSCGENKFFSAVKAKQQQLERLELKRLFYVAQTRAKDYLVLTSVDDEHDSSEYAEKSYSELDSWHKWLRKLANNNIIHSTIWDNEQDYSQEVLPPISASGENLPQPILNFIDRNLAIIGEENPYSLQPFSASMIGCYRRCPRAYFYHYIQHIPQLSMPINPVNYEDDLFEDSGNKQDRLAMIQQDGYSGRLLGIVVHKFIELYQSGSVAAILDKALAQTLPAGLQQVMRQAALPICQGYSEHPFTGVSVRSEWPFTFAVTDGQGQQFIFRGIIDKIIESPQGCHLIDFKTDEVTAAGLPEKINHYSFQLQLYALAVRTVLKQSVVKASLYFLRSNYLESVVLPPENVFLSSLLVLCRFLATHHQETDYGCNTETCHYCDYAAFCPHQN